MKTITIKINPNGSDVHVDAQGFKGRSCTDFMGVILKALGGSIDEQHKPEYNHVAAPNVQMKS